LLIYSDGKKQKTSISSSSKMVKKKETSKAISRLGTVKEENGKLDKLF
jgi:hypothetical protein